VIPRLYPSPGNLKQGHEAFDFNRDGGVKSAFGGKAEAKQLENS
jgi:hypothetical protein